MADVWGALSDATRRQILRYLREHDMNACEIAEKFAISKPSISHHLGILKSADLVRADKVGQNVIYRLNTSVLEDLMGLIAGMIEKEGEQNEG